MHVLFVEDHRVFAETVANNFLAAHEVQFAESISGARRLIAAGVSYDVVLVDFDLPDGKGTEVVRHLRSIRFRGRIVAVSAKDEGNEALCAAGAHITCKKAELHRIGTVLQRLSAA